MLPLRHRFVAEALEDGAEIAVKRYREIMSESVSAIAYFREPKPILFYLL